MRFQQLTVLWDRWSLVFSVAGGEVDSNIPFYDTKIGFGSVAAFYRF